MELDKIKGLKKNLVLLAMIELIGGLFMIINSDNSGEIIAGTLGIIAAAYGIISFFVWLVKKEKTNTVQTVITLILGLVAGAFLIFFYGSIKEFVTLILGIVAAVFGILKLPNMFSLKKAGFKKWAIILIPVAVTVALGIIVGMNAFGKNEKLASILLGISFIADCATDILSIAGVTETEKNFKNSTEIVEDGGKKS